MSKNRPDERRVIADDIVRGGPVSLPLIPPFVFVLNTHGNLTERATASRKRTRRRSLLCLTRQRQTIFPAFSVTRRLMRPVLSFPC
jgi:hypothetical protein